MPNTGMDRVFPQLFLWVVVAVSSAVVLAAIVMQIKVEHVSLLVKLGETKYFINSLPTLS